MLKAAGCILILFASVGLAYSIQCELKNHLQLLYEIQKLFSNILYEEQYSMQPVEYILLYKVKTEHKLLLETCQEIGARLNEKEHGSGERVWQEAFFQRRKQLALSEEEAVLIEGTGRAFFGKSMEENQKMLSYYQERLAFLIETERKERREKQKVYQTASIMCGLILIILLI